MHPTYDLRNEARCPWMNGDRQWGDMKTTFYDRPDTHDTIQTSPSGRERMSQRNILWCGWAGDCADKDGYPPTGSLAVCRFRFRRGGGKGEEKLLISSRLVHTPNRPPLGTKGVN